MKINAGLAYTAIQFLVCLVIAVGETNEENFLDLLSEEEGETIDPFSFFYNKAKKLMASKEDFELVQQTEHEAHYDEWIRNGKYQDINDHALQEILFYKRLVNILISNINVEGMDEDIITGSVNLKISRSQMEVLKNFDIGVTSLREIDTILSDAIQAPTYSYSNDILNYLKLMFRLLQTTVITLCEYRDQTLILLGALCIVIMISKMRRRRRLPISSLVYVIVVVSFFMTWWNLIQEAEIKLLAKQMEYSEIPITCQPDKMNLWHKFVSTVFPSNDCHKYYEAMLSNPKLEVTPAVALVHFMSTVVLHPLGLIGHAISNFIMNATDGLPWAYAWIVKLLLFLSVILVILLIPFCVWGASFNLGLGPLINFGIDFRRKHAKGTAIQEKREPVQIILQVPQGTGVQAIANTSENGRSKVVQAIMNSAPEEVLPNGTEVIKNSEDDASTKPQDFASGDSLKDNDLEVPVADTKTNQDKSNTTRPKKEVGCGDC